MDTDGLRYAQVAEKELQAYLAEKDPTLRNVDHLITEYVSSIPELKGSDFSGIAPKARTSFSKTLSLPSPKIPRTDSGKRISKLTAASANNLIMFASYDLLVNGYAANLSGLSFAIQTVRRGWWRRERLLHITFGSSSPVSVFTGAISKGWHQHTVVFGNWKQ